MPKSLFFSKLHFFFSKLDSFTSWHKSNLNYLEPAWTLDSSLRGRNSPRSWIKEKKKTNKTQTVIWEALFERNLCSSSCRQKSSKDIEPRAGGVLDCPQLLASVRTTVSWLESSQLHSVVSLRLKKKDKIRKKESSTRRFIFITRSF